MQPSNVEQRLAQELRELLLSALAGEVLSAAATDVTPSQTPALGATTGAAPNVPTLDLGAVATQAATTTSASRYPLRIRPGAYPSVLRPENYPPGTQSPTPGPCECGFKHWLDGVEYDYVFELPTTKGRKFLGYNAGDNPYILARDFIIQHRLNEHSLDDTVLVSSIANLIIENTAANTSTEAKAAQEQTNTSACTFDPFHPTLNRPHSGVAKYNKETGKWEGVTYHESDSEAKKRQETLSKQHQALRHEMKQQQEERERIRERMRLDKLEREARKRQEQELRQMQQLDKRPVVEQGGIVRWVADPRPSPSVDTVMAAHEADKRPGLSLQAPSHTPPQPAHATPHLDTATLDDLEDPEEWAAYLPPSSLRPAHAAPSSAPRSTSRFRTVADIRQGDSATAPSELSTPQPKEAWTLPLMLEKYQLLGAVRFAQEMQRSGFNDEDIAAYLTILTTLFAARSGPSNALKTPAAHPEPSTAASVTTPKPPPHSTNFRAFQGTGHSLAAQTSPPHGTSSLDNPASFASSSYESAPPATSAVPLVTPTPPTETETPPTQVTVDLSQPHCSLQIRLLDGTRLVTKFNHTHTIADVRRYIESNAPHAASRQYELVLSFPTLRKVLSNHQQTIEQAGLINATIIQSPQ